MSNALAVWRHGSPGTLQTVSRSLHVTCWLGCGGRDRERRLGLCREPQIAMDASGNAIAVWEKEEGDGNRAYSVWANRYRPNVGWRTAVRLESGAGSAAFSQIAMNAAGNAVAVWSDSTEPSTVSGQTAMHRTSGGAPPRWPSPTTRAMRMYRRSSLMRVPMCWRCGSSPTGCEQASSQEGTSRTTLGVKVCRSILKTSATRPCRRSQSTPEGMQLQFGFALTARPTASTRNVLND